MADAPVNFKRPSSRGRKSKRISDLISNHNSSSQAEQSKSKKAKSRPSKYTVLEKRPVSLRVTPSNAQSSKQLRDAAKKAPAATIGRPLPTQPLELSPPTYCAECGAKKFAFETLHFCCGNGDIKIVANEYPPELVRLFTSRDEDAVHFRKYARLYNNLFAFSSIGGKTDRETYKDQRVYNAPTSDEVAVIWPDSVSSSQSSWPHVLVTAKSAKSHRIAHFYGCYDPLQYPLLFPRGECGWHQGLKKTSYGGDRQVAAEPDPIQSCAVNTPADFLDAEAARASGRHTKADKNISAREYYAYKLQIRPGNMLLRAGRAFLQYITDMYIKVENTRKKLFKRRMGQQLIDEPSL